MNPLKSRKSMIATLASLVATAISSFAAAKGWVPDEKLPELVETLVEVIVGIWSVVIIGIAHEDKGAKEGLPTPPVQAPKPPAAVPFVLAALLLGASAAHAGAPVPLIDLGTLTPGETGRQNDKGLPPWPQGWVLQDVIVVPVVREESTGHVYLLDPAELVAGRAAAHKWLVCMDGAITNRKTAERLIRANLQAKARTLALAVAGEVAGRLPESMGNLAPSIAQDVIRALLRGAR